MSSSPAPPVPCFPARGVFAHWRESLATLLAWFTALRRRTRAFYAKAFVLFVALNFACFWWALLTAYPNTLATREGLEITLMSLPVGILGGLFDFLSLFVTLVIARRALATTSNGSYLGYLSIDIVIAALATLWVLVVFTVAGWLVNLLLALPETLAERRALYRGRFVTAVFDPFHPDSLRNIYFGIIMGASAMLPTLIHLGQALRALARALRTVRSAPP